MDDAGAFTAARAHRGAVRRAPRFDRLAARPTSPSNVARTDPGRGRGGGDNNAMGPGGPPAGADIGPVVGAKTSGS